MFVCISDYMEDLLCLLFGLDFLISSLSKKGPQGDLCYTYANSLLLFCIVNECIYMYTVAHLVTHFKVGLILPYTDVCIALYAQCFLSVCGKNIHR